VAELVDAPHC